MAGRHLYTSDTNEITVLVASGWKNEGVAFYTPNSSGDPVHRLFNPVTGKHHYVSQSQGAAEIEVLTSTGWKDDGVLFYADECGRVELTRLYNSSVVKHLHSADQTEIDALVAAGWNNEGISFYVTLY